MSDGQSVDLRLDHDRARRTGAPEVVFGEGKTADQCARAVAEMLAHGHGPVLVTRADGARADAVRAIAPTAEYDATARVVTARRASTPLAGTVAIALGGTSDLPVARECQVVLAAFGVAVEIVADIGVAGLHRVLGAREQLAAADVVVVVAGMEAALPTVVAGLIDAPIVAVPTSVGYGASFDGLAALLGMLTSCAPGITVVNIDAGFSAAMAAMRMLQLRARVGSGR